MTGGSKICKHSGSSSCTFHNLQCSAPTCFVNSDTGLPWQPSRTPKQALQDDLVEYFEHELHEAETAVVATSSYPADAAWNADCIKYRDRIKDLLERVKKYSK